MKGCINGFDWVNCEAMKYWSFPASFKGDKMETAKNFVFSGEYMGSLKVDGYYERIVKDDEGNCFMIARNKDKNGKAINKIEWIPHINPFFAALPNGTCLLCECYLPGNEGSKKITTLLGCLKDKCIARQEANQKLHLYVFDVMAYAGKDYTKVPYQARAAALTSIKEKYDFEYVDFTEFFEGKQLWYKIQEFLADGREGMVIMKKDAPVYFKRTPARVSIKIKKEIKETIDCIFTGKVLPPTKEYTGKDPDNWTYWVDIVTGEKLQGNFGQDYYKGKSIMPVTKNWFLGLAGSLEIGLVKGDKVVPFGYLSGLTEEIKGNPEKYKGRVIEVSAMEIDAVEHTLRHGKMLGFRDDLKITDCLWEKVFG